MPNLAIFQPSRPSISTHVSDRFETAARSPAPNVAAAVFNADSRNTLMSAVVAHFRGSKCTVSTITNGSIARASGFGTTTAGEPGGEVVERDCRLLRVAVPAGEVDLEPVLAARIPLTASAVLLLEATLEDFVWRLLGGMFARAVPARLEMLGS